MAEQVINKEKKPVSENRQSVMRSLKAAAVLLVIAAVSVLILALCNKFFPAYVPKLDAQKVAQLNSTIDVGVDNTTALNEKYYQMLTADDFNLEKFNKQNKATGSVLAIYKVAKGDKAGTYITETQTTGYGSQVMVILTAFDSGLVVRGFNAIETNGDYVLENRTAVEEIKEGLIGIKIPQNVKSVFTTGATASYSISGINKNLSLSAKAVGQITGGTK